MIYIWQPLDTILSPNILDQWTQNWSYNLNNNDKNYQSPINLNLVIKKIY
jgi:hypothetical protein